MYKKIICIFLIPMILTTGCWDSKDINEKAITISVGINSVNNLIQFTGEIVKLTKTSQETQTRYNTPGIYNVYAYGKTFEEVRRKLESMNPFDVFQGACRIVMFSASYGKLGIEPYLNRIDSLYDYRKTVLLVITREPPEELFNVKTDKAIAIGFLVDNLLSQLKEKGKSICPNVGELLSDIAFGSLGYVMPYIGKEFGDIKYLGLAVLKNSKLIDIIDITDTKPILYILAKDPTLIELISNPIDAENKYSFRISIDKRKISTAYKNDTVIINIDLNLDAELRYQYHIQKITNDMIKYLEKEISSKISNDIFNMIRKAQKEFECDIFSFGRYFKAYHYKQFRKMNWEDAFLTAKINVNVNTKIVNKNLKSFEEKE
ncbi:Ger(x)C family spore germination protein [Vallitalea maricola]|uniref:Ger(X)C family spore germination protein n=1 Tax=Vallitalea maricola TaxID=3074433 RepID=A0ACB5UMP1_9FIRM|nr:Ger(x)C family spore germination protein [Vallitalea sp. AN17-2]